MHVRHISISRFRGIARLEWTVPVGPLALVGPGDSCKTTILDAIELALSPRWNPHVSDNDFFMVDTSEPAVIEVTVGALSPLLISDRKFGLDLRGMNAEGELHDEPEPDDELVLTVRFTLSSDLEPSWAVINERLSEPRPISARDRELLGASRLGGDPDRHFAWGRGSALTAADSMSEELGRILAAAQRAMRDSASKISMTDLDSAVSRASLAATQVGAGRVADTLRAAVSADTVAARGSGLALHTNEIPLERSGLGTRRLVALGLQRLAVPAGAIMLVDEIEGGLEPFRLRHLLRQLQRLVSPLKGVPGSHGQVILTTHSPTALEELDASHVQVVQRSDVGEVHVRSVPPYMQDTLRAVPESFLARRVLVCEGKTEIGLCRALEPRWARAHQARPMSHVGTALALGNGHQTGERAAAFRELGYPVAVFADSDRPLVPSTNDLEQSGVVVVLWADNVATEARLCLDLPRSALEELVVLAIDDRTLESVRDAVFSRLGTQPPTTETPTEWIDAIGDEAAFREAFGSAAGDKKWFKRVDLGEEVGQIVSRYWEELEDTDLRSTLERLEQWIYADDWA